MPTAAQTDDYTLGMKHANAVRGRMIVSGPRSAGQERGRESAVQSKWHSTHYGDANAEDHIYTWAKCSVAMTALWRHGKRVVLVHEVNFGGFEDVRGTVCDKYARWRSE